MAFNSTDDDTPLNRSATNRESEKQTKDLTALPIARTRWNGERSILKTYSTGSAAQAVKYSDYNQLQLIDEQAEGDAQQQQWSAEGVKLLSKKITDLSESKSEKSPKNRKGKSSKVTSYQPRSFSFKSEVSLENEEEEDEILIETISSLNKGKVPVSSHGGSQDPGSPVQAVRKAKSEITDVSVRVKDPTKKRLL